MASLDFFSQGIKSDSGLQFTKEEKEFFTSKLALLDPKKTESIEIGKIIWFLTLARISSDYRQKIMKSCKLDAGKKTFNYEEVKKVFRAIALAQKQIDPSNININANIKTKMPVFYDDDDDDEEQEKPPTNQPPAQRLPVPAQPQQAPTSPRQPQNFFQKPSQDTARTQPQKPESKKADMFADFQAFPKKAPPQSPPEQKPQPPPPQQRQKQNPLAIKMREFEVRWGKLKTHDNKIDGNEVKNLCKNLSQRSNLAKAWKLCCHTHSKSLTKGQFFVFLQIVASPNMPENLTHEMKNCISVIDRAQKAKPQQQLQKSTPISKESIPSSTKMATSQLFDNFGKSQLSINQPSKPSIKVQEKVDNRLSQKLNNINTNIKEISKNENRNVEDIHEIKRNQQTMNNVLGQLQQYLDRTKENTDVMKNAFTELKQNQQVLSERLNRACYFINQIVKKQNNLIQELANDYAQQNNASLQRVGNLEKYVQDLTQELHQKDAIIKQLTNKVSANPSPQNPPQRQIQPSTPPVQQKQPQFTQEVQHEHQPEHVQAQERERQTVHQEEEAVPMPKQPQKQREEPQQEEEPIAQEQKSKVPEQNEQQQRLMNLRIQVFQLLRYIRSVSPEDQPKLVQYIKQYSQQDLNRAYIQCYQQYQVKQKQQQLQAEQRKAQSSKPTSSEDQFSSSNFSGQPSAPQEDMFG